MGYCRHGRRSYAPGEIIKYKGKVLICKEDGTWEETGFWGRLRQQIFGAHSVNSEPVQNKKLTRR